MLTSVAFVAMFAVFSYVDISWDAQNMVLLSLAFAIIGSTARFERDDRRADRAAARADRVPADGADGRPSAVMTPS